MPNASSLSESTAAFFYDPSKYSPSCSHHLRDTHAPGLQEDFAQRFIIVRVAIFCATVFCLLVTYVPILSKPDFTIASSNELYSQLPPPFILGCVLVIFRTTLCRKLLRPRSILGISTHVSVLNNSTAWVTTLEKSPDTFGSAPSRIKISDNHPQLFLSF